MDRLKNKKVFVGKNSKEVQEKIFKLGFKYPSGSTEFNFKDPFLFFDSYGEVYSSGDLEFFNNHEYEEVTPGYILSLEVEKKPKWEDFGKVNGYYPDIHLKPIYDANDISTIVFPSYEEAQACIALSLLCQWRDKYNNGWKPDWTDSGSCKYVIEVHKDYIDMKRRVAIQRTLAFKTEEIMYKFLEDFKDLIKIAKPLL